MGESTYNMEFHFPYDRVTLERVTAAEMIRYRSALHAGRVFEVQGRDYAGNLLPAEHTINPAMVTYAKVTPYTPF